MKKGVKKFIINILVSLMLLQPMAPFISDAQAAEAPVIEQTPPKEGKIELVDKRTEKTKTYLKSDGSKELVVYQEPIHFQNGEEKGKARFEEINNNIEEASVLSKAIGNNSFKNKKNDFNLNFSKDLSKQSFSIDRKGSAASLDLKNIASTKKGVKIGFDKKSLNKKKYEKKDTSLTYKAVVKDTDLTYYSMPSGVKEYITLNKYNGQNVFKFDLKLSNAYFEKQPDGGYKFFNKKTKEEIFSMPRFFMWDSKGGKDNEQNAYSYDVTSEINQQGNNFELTITADDKWLSSKDRNFPVIIDPTFTVYSAEDTYVQSGYPTTRAWDQRALYVGRGETKGAMRTLMKFDIPDLTGARVFGGNYEVLQYGNCSGVCTWAGVIGFTTGSFNPWDVHWNNQPGLVWGIGSGQTASTWDWFRMDVGTAIRHWYNEGNHTGSYVGALEFRQDREDLWGFRTWASRNHPDYSWGQPRINISYNDYNAFYAPTDVPNMIAGTTTEVPVFVSNVGRNTWYKGGTNPTSLSYHWVNSAGVTIMKDGLRTSLPNDIRPKGSATILAKVKVPPMAGQYTLKWDLVHEGITWFSDQGILSSNKIVAVTAPAFSAMTHLGTEKYYAKAGPVDLATGNLAFSNIDMNVSSENNQLVVSRSYNSNSNNLSKTYNHDAKGYIRKWSINGPYKENDQAWRLVRQYIRNEHLVKPSPGSTSNNIVWMDVEEPNTSQMWLNQGLLATGASQLDWATNVATYANVYVYSPVKRDVYLRMGSDDGLKVWLNGKLVHFKDIYRGLTLDSDFVGVSLNEGWNQLMVKTSQGAGGYQMSARFTDSAGSPFSDLEYSTYNPEVVNDEKVLGKGWSTSFDEKIYNFNKDYTYENNFDYTTAGTEMRPVAGTWTHTDGVYKQTNNTLGQKWASTNKTFSGTYTYEFDYKITYDPTNRKHSGAIVDWQPGTVNGYRLTHLDGSFVAEKWVNGVWTSLANVADQGINPALNSVHIKVVRNTTTGSILFYANDRLMINFVDTTFKGGAVGFHTWDGTTEFDNVKVTTASEEVYYRDGSGNINIFYRNNDGSYVLPPGVSTRLVRNEDNTFSLVEKSGTRTNFGLDGRLKERVDLLGNKVNYLYENGKLVKIVDGDPIGVNRYIELSYNQDGRLNALKDQAGNVVNYGYDENGNLASITDPEGAIHNYLYTNGYLTESRNRNGSATKIQYANRKVSALTDALNNTTSFTYINGVTEIKDALGRISKAAFDSGNLLTSFTDANGYKERYLYDGRYNLTVSAPDLPENHELFYRWSNTYDVNDNLTSTKDPKGVVTTYEYSGNNLLRIKDGSRNNLITASALYSPQNQLLQETDANSNTVKFTYDNRGRKISETDAKGISSYYEYNSFGDKISLRTGTETSPVKFEYDLIGRKVASVSALGSLTTYTYDRNSRVTSTVVPGGITSRVEYDKDGNVLKEVDPKGNTKTYEYDALGQLLRMTDEGGAVIENKYDAVGNKIETKDPKGKIKRFHYDKLDQLIKEEEADGKASTLEYKLNGDITKNTDTKGNVFTPKINNLGELTSITKPEGVSNFSYDTNGSLIQQKASLRKGVALYRNNFSKVDSNLKAVNGNWSYGGYRLEINSGDAYSLYENKNWTDYSFESEINIGSREGGVAFRAKDVNNHYLVLLYPDGKYAALYKKVNGAYTLLSIKNSLPLYNNNNYKVRVDTLGTNIKVYIDGVLQVEANDSTYSSGTIGVRAFGNSTLASKVIFNNLKVKSSGAILYESNFAKDTAGWTTNNAGTWRNEKERLSTSINNGESLTLYKDKSWDNYTFETDVNVLTNQAHLVFRAKDKDNHYLLGIYPNEDFLTLFKRVGGTYQEFAKATGVPISNNVSQRIKIELVDSNIKVYHNNVLKLNVNDSTYQRGTIGFRSSGISTVPGNVIFDNVSVYSSNEKNLFSLDNDKRRVSVSSGLNGKANYQYDQNDAQTAVVTENSSINFTYDEKGSVKTVSSAVVTNSTPAVGGVTVNSLGQTVNVMTSGTSIINRDLEGKITTVQKANGDEVIHEYDPVTGRLISITTRHGSEVMSSYSYEYDSNSNQTEVRDNKGNVKNYGYDARNQLVNDDGMAIAYDELGNRKTVTSADGSVTRYLYQTDLEPLNSLADPSRLMKVEYQNGGFTTYKYDSNGNVVEKIDFEKNEAGDLVSEITKIEYDSEDYFTKAVLPDGKTIEYIYDESGKRRVQRIETSPSGEEKIINFQYDEDRLITETDLEGNILRSYTWDEDENLISVAIPSADNVLKNYYYVKNARGDVIGMTDESGKLVAEYDYDTWGTLKEIKSSEDNPGLAENNPRRYASYWYDDSLEMYFLKSRMYDSSIGRYYAKDPVISEDENAIEYNPYVYCGNNPVTRVDKDGKFWHIVAGAVVGAAIGIYQGLKEGKTGWDLAKSAAGGAVTGALMMTGVGGIARLGISAGAKMIATGAGKRAVTNIATRSAGKAVTSITRNAFNNAVRNTGSAAVGRTVVNVPMAFKGGFNTFNGLKKALGSPGVNSEWHHIVEQSQISRSSFNPEMIHNFKNVIAVEKQLHHKISGHYSRKMPGTDMTVRNWLNGKSYEFQYNYGIKVLNNLKSL